MVVLQKFHAGIFLEINREVWVCKYMYKASIFRMPHT